MSAALLPDVVVQLYGDSITVIRTIKRDGASGYKLKSKAGRVVSTKVDDVRAMCDSFNIQVARSARGSLLAPAVSFAWRQLDNPCAILMQDTSREFLNSATPAQKYKWRARQPRALF